MTSANEPIALNGACRNRTLRFGENRPQPRDKLGADRGGDNDVPGSPAKELG